MNYNARHKKKCGCVDCIRNIKQKLAGKHSDTAVMLITNRYKRLLIKNMKFNTQPRGRFDKRLILSKEFRGDEWITLNTYEYQLIKCVKCKTLAKAYSYSKRHCCVCSHNKSAVEQNTCIWSSWGRTA